MMTLTLEDVRSIAYALQRAVASYQPGQLDDPAALRAAFGAYAEAVEAVNQRLRSAHAILRQGRRAEALHACEAEPNLLDCVQELDSSDQLATEWAPTLEELGIDRPEPLLGDLAMELGAAYDSKHQLANLTRLLRLLAIGRGPLEERVKVLRRIAILDTENTVWLDDLRAHEDRCIRELRAELDGIRQLRASRLTGTLAARATTIARLLSSPDWQDPLPGEEVDRIQATVAAISRTRARSALRKIGDSLVAAHEAGDVAAARALCDRWDALEGEARPDEDDAEFAAARDARNWVADHDARQQRLRDAEAAAAEIRGACDAGVPFSPGAARALHGQIRTSLASLHDTAYEPDAAAAFADVVAAGRRRMTQLARVPVRFWTIVSVAACLAIGTSAWAVGLLVSRNIESRRRAAVAARVEQECLSDDVSLPHTTERWSGFMADHSWLSGHSVATKVTDRINELENKRDDDRKSLQTKVDSLAKCLEKLRHAIDDYKGGRTEHDDAETALKDIDRDIEKAKMLVRDFEKLFARDDIASQITALKEHADTASEEKSRFESRVDEFKKQRADAIERRVRAIETTATASMKAEDLRGIRDAIDDLVQVFGPAADVWARRLKDIEAKIDDREHLAGLRKRLERAAAKGLDDYLSEIGELATRDLHGPATSLPDVVASGTAVKAALAWARVADAWDAKAAFDPASVKHETWSEAIATALDATPRPQGFTDAVRTALERLLDKLRSHKADHDERFARLERKLTMPVMAKTVREFVPQADDPAFYTTAENLEKGRYFRNELAETTFDQNLKDVEFRRTEPAKHVAFAEQALVVIRGIKQAKTDVDVGLERLLSLFPNSSPAGGPVDVLLRCELLVILLEAMQDRPCYADIDDLVKLRDAIEEQVGDEPKWIDPRTRHKGGVDPAKRILMDADQRFMRIRDGFRKWRDELVARPSCCRPLTFVGWIDQDGEALLVRTAGSAKAATDSRLVVVLTDGDDTYRIATIGRMRGEEPVITDSSPLRFGQPVFAESTK